MLYTRGLGGVEVLVGDVAAHGEEYHQGAEHGHRAASQIIQTQTQIAMVDNFL